LTEIHIKHKLAVSVDCVVFGYNGESLHLLLIDSNMTPFEGQESLIGDLVHSDESLNEAANRVLLEKANLESVNLEQVEVFSAVKRHPIARVITIAYYALLKIDEHVIKDSQHRGLKWKPLDQIENLAFDHDEIYHKCLLQLRHKINNDPASFKLLPEKFTINDLQELYEVILDLKIDKRNFRRKLNSLEVLVESEQHEEGVHHRPAKLYSFNHNLKLKDLNLVPSYKEK